MIAWSHIQIWYTVVWLHVQTQYAIAGCTFHHIKLNVIHDCVIPLME